MSSLDISAFANKLPAAWESRVISRVGSAALKILRMDGQALPEEVHGYTEVLLVLEGVLHLESEGRALAIVAGELFEARPGVPHRVLAGSQGTLLIIDQD